MRKTIKQWYVESNASWKEHALSNLLHMYADKYASSESEALTNGFIWQNTPQGQIFWQDAAARAVINAVQEQIPPTVEVKSPVVITPNKVITATLVPYENLSEVPTTKWYRVKNSERIRIDTALVSQITGMNLENTSVLFHEWGYINLNDLFKNFEVCSNHPAASKPKWNPCGKLKYVVS